MTDSLSRFIIHSYDSGIDGEERWVAHVWLTGQKGALPATSFGPYREVAEGLLKAFLEAEIARERAREFNSAQTSERAKGKAKVRSKAA